MPSKNKEFEQAYDTVDMSGMSYTDDVITIDLNDEDIMRDFDITKGPYIGKLPDDFTVDAGATEFDYNNITLYNPWEEFCEYVGIEKSQDVEDFKRMCERYPALEKALAQFKNTYNIVKDDWNSENNQ
jgi:hypothetical protein